MTDLSFFPPHAGLPLSEIAQATSSRFADETAADTKVTSIASLSEAEPGQIAYFKSRRFLADLVATRATAVFCPKAFVDAVPQGTVALVTASPQHAFAKAGALLHAKAARPRSLTGTQGVSPQAYVHPEARLEDDVTVEPTAVVGAGAEIGGGTVIGPGAVVGEKVRIGRNCSIGAGVTVQCALIGNHVILHPGVRLGQDGFGYVSSFVGHDKLVQIGRIIIQDHVEIGANSAIDRGALGDTVIGEGTKIDNLVQIGHNCRIGRYCIIVANVGIAGSTTLGDFVVLGGGVGVNGHTKIGDGAQIAAMAGVVRDVPPGVRYGGIPARPVRDWLREMQESYDRAEAKARKRGADK